MGKTCTHITEPLKVTNDDTAYAKNTFCQKLKTVGFSDVSLHYTLEQQHEMSAAINKQHRYVVLWQ